VSEYKNELYSRADLFALAPNKSYAGCKSNSGGDDQDNDNYNWGSGTFFSIIRFKMGGKTIADDNV
jgi:hypothetical protein